MRIQLCYLTPLFAAAVVCAAVTMAPVAAATPQCTNVGPNTTQCQTNGSSQIITSPPVNNWYGGWPWGGGIVIGLGGFGRGGR
jgi:hypothetical protein